MPSGPEPSPSFIDAVRAEWSEIGGLGRLALAGVVASLVVAVVLGFAITRAVRDHLLHSRSDLFAAVTGELATLNPDPAAHQVDLEFDEAVRLRLLGGETVRVKLWLPDGTIAYSDSPDLIGRTFELSASAESALLGEASYLISDLSDPAHAGERDLGRLIEFYIPYGAGDAPIAAFEIEQLTSSLDESMSLIARNVWLSIGSGIAVLGLFLAALIVARASDLNRRRRQAERLLASLLRAQEEERERIVGALHDEVGQPLYRLLYGIEGSRSKVGPGHPAATELQQLSSLVRDIDAILRREMRILHGGLEADAGLERALTGLVELTRSETDLDVVLDSDIPTEPDPVPRAAILRAVREGVTNARKHSGAGTVEVVARGTDSLLTVEVVDDGSGGRIVPGLGLSTTRERLEAIGGGLAVTSRRGEGTRYRVWIPLEGAGRR